MTHEHMLQTIARHEERLNQQEKQVDYIKNLASGVYELTADVKNLTAEVKKISGATQDMLTKIDEKLDNEIRTLRQETDARFREHGIRLGELKDRPGRTAEKNQESIRTAAITALISVLVTAIVTYLLVNVGAY